VSTEAIQHVRRMRGGAQSHLMRCSDGYFYVVKFRNNPQHLRVLTNEMLAGQLAQEVGLPVPTTEIVQVGEWLIEHTPELNVQLSQNTIKCIPGSQFGSKYVVDPTQGQVLDYMPADMLGRVRNRETFAGMLAFDKWTGNTDGRQVAFWRLLKQRRYTATFIDQGYCFNGGDWTFLDGPFMGAYPKNEAYESIVDWGSFEPWLKRIEQLSESRAWEIGNAIPSEWYSGESGALRDLISTLLLRRTIVRELIDQFRRSVRQPFPHWRGEA
jgi:hypothetical protein